MYGRPAWSQQPSGYGLRPPYPGSPGGPPTTAGPTNPAQPYGGQPPYQDQHQVCVQGRNLLVFTSFSNFLWFSGCCVLILFTS